MRGLIWTVLISITILASGLILYFSNFNNSYANNSDEWADFATFNGYFLSIVNLIILGYISLITYEATKAFNRLQIRPLLFITLDKPEQIKGQFKDSWFAENGAKNAALNLIIRYQKEIPTRIQNGSLVPHLVKAKGWNCSGFIGLTKLRFVSVI